MPAANPRTRAVDIEVKDAFGNPVPTTPKRRPGRPANQVAGAAAKAKVNPTTSRPVKRAAIRDDQAYGRDGEILTRNRVSGDGYVNEFDIHESARDPMFDLYWARTSCHGKADNANINELYDNGWRPASPKNYEKVMPDMKDKGAIERDGLMLMERPWKLSQQALDEQYQVAVELREIQSEAFGKRKLPKGFDKGRKAKDGNFNASKMLNRTNEPSPKAAKPEYTYATPGEDE